MKHRLSKLFLALLVLCGLAAFSPPAQAGPLVLTPLPTAPGSTTLVNPVTTVWVAEGDILLASIVAPVANASFNGIARTAVFRNNLGTLDFYYQFTNDASSLNSVTRVSTFNFGNVTTSVAQVGNGTAIFGGIFVDGTPVFGVADSASRDAAPGETVGFNFTPPPLLQPGSTSFVFVIRTNATNFSIGNFGIIDGITANAPAFAPVAQEQPIPEPATLLLFGTGLAGVGAAVRKRRRAKKSEID